MKLSFQNTLDDIDRSIDVSRESQAALRFMIAWCRNMHLSKVAANSLAVAERYLNGLATAAELEQVRVACWHSIDGRDMNIVDQEVAATRAVICMLFPLPWEGDIFNLLDLFGDFAMCAGVSEIELSATLRKEFLG